MKNLFPEYENNRPLDYAEIWKRALFVFDTNVLLNLYRYRVGTRDALLELLTEISDQVWIPYQVALEFQRNRLSVIAEQARRFNEVKRSIEKSKSALITDLAKFKLQERHSVINPETLISDFEKVVESFFEKLNVLEKDQQTIFNDDSLKRRLEDIFDGRVGAEFKKQNELDEIHKNGETRYKYRIPPGYQDDDKDSKVPDEFMHGGLIYKRKFGDLVIWKQLLKHCDEEKIETLVFVTDDAKEDWWRIIDQDGPKTIGPRPELIDEARREAGIQTFLMYTPDKFLAYSKEALTTKISDDAIQEVKDVSLTSANTRTSNLSLDALAGKTAVRSWLASKYDQVYDSVIHPGLSVIRDGKRYMFLPVVAENGMLRNIYDHVVSAYIYTSTVFSFDEKSNLERTAIVLINRNRLSSAIAVRALQEAKSSKPGEDVGIDVFVTTMVDSTNPALGFSVSKLISL